MPTERWEFCFCSDILQVLSCYRTCMAELKRTVIPDLIWCSVKMEQQGKPSVIGARPTSTDGVAHMGRSDWSGEKVSDSRCAKMQLVHDQLQDQII